MSVSKLDPTTDDPGHYVGNYKLVRLLGQGGFAAVYLARHIYLDTPAAVKILHTCPSEADAEKFYVEARLAARLHHPHIIRVLDFGLEDEAPFLVMDCAARGTLRQRYPAGSRLAPDAIIEYVGQIAEAVQYIHDKGLIHRDIKPENLLLGRNNELLLSDFGITIAARKVTSEQVTVGTIAYMAPEQIEGYPCLASDQYALGVVVYEWLCGARPFRGSTRQVIQQHLRIAPPSLCKRVPTIPRSVEQVVLRALAKDPRDRFESVQAFADALRAAFEEKNMQVTRTRKVWKEITAFYAMDVLLGAVLGGVLYGLGATSLLLQVPLALCMVLLPLVGALMRKNRSLLFLTWSIAAAAGVIALLLHTFVLFLVAYSGLLLLSLLTAFAVSVNEQ